MGDYKHYIWAAIALIVAVALAYFLISISVSEGEPIASSKFDSDLIDIDREAVREAYHTQVVHLFVIWMKDERGQPGRALVGVGQARRAFVEAMTEIEKREQRR
jgi:hypothetical protein